MAAKTPLRAECWMLNQLVAEMVRSGHKQSQQDTVDRERGQAGTAEAPAAGCRLPSMEAWDGVSGIGASVLDTVGQRCLFFVQVGIVRGWLSQEHSGLDVHQRLSAYRWLLND